MSIASGAERTPSGRRPGATGAVTTEEERTKAATIFADRNAQRKRVIGDDESAEWINAVLYRFWQFYEPGACDTHSLTAVGQPASCRGG